MSFLSSLVRSPWAIEGSYRPIIAAILARLVRGERLGAEGLEAVRQQRREWDARHASESPAAREEGPFQRVHASDSRSGDIAVIGVYGVITQRGGMDTDTSEPLSSAQRIARAVQLAAADSTVGGIVLDVDSPGGSVYGLAELGDAIYGARAAKPVAAVANSLAASAAYWAASQASELYAAPGGEVGSVGVYTIHYDISDALRQAGVAPTVISSTPRKVETLPFDELGTDARAYIQGSIDEYYDQFVRAVARGRGATQKSVREDMGQGRVFGAERAKAANMIDGIATLDQVIGRMQQRLQSGGGSRRAMASAPTPQWLIEAKQRERELELMRLSTSHLVDET